MNTAYVGIGSNIDKYSHVEKSIYSLRELDPNLRFSTIYESPAFGFEGESFFNLIVEIETSLTLSEFAQRLRQIEYSLGRKTDAQKMQDRTIDLDIILFGDVVCDGDITLPRTDIYRYPFVIQPLLELCPGKVIPGSDETVEQVWRRFGSFNDLTEVERWFS